MRSVCVLLVCGVALAACSSSASGVFDGPLTECAYSTDLTKDAETGKRCTTDEECAPAVCLLPGDDGNVTNEVFGFCTRNCDCNDDHTLSIPGSHASLSCVYPGGCYPGQGFSRFRYAVPRCTSLGDCQAIDAGYTHCQTTDSLTILDTTCGQINAKVCQAHE